MVTNGLGCKQTQWATRTRRALQASYVIDMTSLLLIAALTGQQAGISTTSKVEIDSLYDLYSFSKPDSKELPASVQVKAEIRVELPDNKMSLNFSQAHFDFHHYIGVKSSDGGSFESAANPEEIWAIDAKQKVYYETPVPEGQDFTAKEFRDYMFNLWNTEMAKGFGGKQNDEDPFETKMQVNPVSVPFFYFATEPKLKSMKVETKDGKQISIYQFEGTFENGAIQAKVVVDSKKLISSMLFDLTYDGYLATISVDRTQYKESKAPDTLFDLATRDLKGFKKGAG